MLSYRDPRSGSAGYIAIETVSGHLGDPAWGLRAPAVRHDARRAQTPYYEIVTGSGHAGLESMTGTLESRSTLTGPHRHRLEYEL